MAVLSPLWAEILELCMDFSVSLLNCLKGQNAEALPCYWDMRSKTIISCPCRKLFSGKNLSFELRPGAGLYVFQWITENKPESVTENKSSWKSPVKVCYRFPSLCPIYYKCKTVSPHVRSFRFDIEWYCGFSCGGFCGSTSRILTSHHERLRARVGTLCICHCMHWKDVQFFH